MHRPACIAFAVIASLLGSASRSRGVEHLPADVTQLIISLAPDWNAPRGKLARFERTTEGWRRVSEVIPVAYGWNGLAWGRGVLAGREGSVAPRKTEGDGRAPAGVFALGKVYGEAAEPPAGTTFPYHQVTAADAWIEDPTHPSYNRHVIVDRASPPPWFERERMKLGDPAFRWRVEIRHNADPPVPGAGSAIFFHVTRGPDRLTAGCTTMPEEELVEMIRWLRVEQQPHYVLLPWDEYAALHARWHLPPLEVVAGLAP